MKYQLKPTFKIEDEKYWILSDEISSFSSDEIADILDDIENLFPTNTWNPPSVVLLLQ